MNDDLPKAAALSRTRAMALAAAAGIALVVAFLIGYWPRHQARAALAASTQARAGDVPRVEVIAPKPVSSDRALVLAGNVMPLEETTVYPRAAGYIRRWLVDIGDPVQEGQLLAEIETPEVDQELAQARAQVAQAVAAVAQQKANQTLSKAQLVRYQELVKQHLVSDSEVEQRQAQADVDKANGEAADAAVAAAQANIRRLAQVQSFARVTAPFGGKVTARSVDRGALVSVGNATPLFKIAATDPVRVFVQVPQEVAPSVRADLPAQVTIREYGATPFPGKVARAAGALDPVSRTMNTEVRVPNPDGKLLPGMYAQVALTLPSPHRAFELPATALYNDANGVRVGVVDAGGKLRLVPVTIERDTGATIEIAGGLDGSERVLKLASAALVDGAQVDVAK